MAQTRTALGTNATKVSGTTLSINDVTIPAGRTLVVGIAWDNAQGEPTSVKLGNKDLNLRKKQANADSGITVGIWTRRYLRIEKTRDIVATWSAAITERAMFASYIEEAGIIDVEQGAQQDATTSPATGVAVTTTEANTIHIAAIAANGPDNDTAATANLGHTIGQRIGMSGAPPVSNVTLQETYEILTATGNCRASLTLTTARDCCGVICAFKSRQTYTINDVTQHHRDMNEQADYVRVKCEDESGNAFWAPFIEPEEFDDFTDAEFYDLVRRACSRHARRFLDDGSNVDEDSARDTRMAGFVNDEVTI